MGGELAIDVGRVLVAPLFPAPGLVVVIRQLVELAHGPMVARQKDNFPGAGDEPSVKILIFVHIL
jgi:hypothetical protein